MLKPWLAAARASAAPPGARPRRNSRHTSSSRPRNGIGEKYHPLPWDVLTYSPEHDGYVVDLDRNRLEGAPSYAVGETGLWDDPAYGRRITDYYAEPLP